MFAKMNYETKLGGFFGVVTLLAICFELYLNGFDAKSLAGSLKDIGGTMVSVMVFLVAAKSFLDNSARNLREELLFQMDKFETDHLPLIFKVQGFKQRKDEPYIQGFCILREITQYPSLIGTIAKDTDVYNKYASYTSKSTGKFVDFPEIDAMLAETSNTSNFPIKFGFISSNNYPEHYQTVIENSIRTKFSPHQYSIHSKSNNFIIEIPCFQNIDDINRMFSLLAFVIHLYEIGNQGVGK